MRASSSSSATSDDSGKQASAPRSENRRRGKVRIAARSARSRLREITAEEGADEPAAPGIQKISIRTAHGLQADDAAADDSSGSGEDSSEEETLNDARSDLQLRIRRQRIDVGDVPEEGDSDDEENAAATVPERPLIGSAGARQLRDRLSAAGAEHPAVLENFRSGNRLITANVSAPAAFLSEFGVSHAHLHERIALALRERVQETLSKLPPGDDKLKRFARKNFCWTGESAPRSLVLDALARSESARAPFLRALAEDSARYMAAPPALRRRLWALDANAFDARELAPRLERFRAGAPAASGADSVRLDPWRAVPPVPAVTGDAADAVMELVTLCGDPAVYSHAASALEQRAIDGDLAASSLRLELALRGVAVAGDSRGALARSLEALFRAVFGGASAQQGGRGMTIAELVQCAQRSAAAGDRMLAAAVSALGDSDRNVKNAALAMLRAPLVQQSMVVRALGLSCAWEQDTRLAVAKGDPAPAVPNALDSAIEAIALSTGAAVSRRTARSGARARTAALLLAAAARARAEENCAAGPLPEVPGGAAARGALRSASARATPRILTTAVLSAALLGGAELLRDMSPALRAVSPHDLAVAKGFLAGAVSLCLSSGHGDASHAVVSVLGDHQSLTAQSVDAQMLAVSVVRDLADLLDDQTLRSAARNLWAHGGRHFLRETTEGIALADLERLCGLYAALCARRPDVLSAAVLPELHELLNQSPDSGLESSEEEEDADSDDNDADLVTVKQGAGTSGGEAKERRTLLKLKAGPRIASQSSSAGDESGRGGENSGDDDDDDEDEDEDDGDDDDDEEEEDDDVDDDDENASGRARSTSTNKGATATRLRARLIVRA